MYVCAQAEPHAQAVGSAADTLVRTLGAEHGLILEHAILHALFRLKLAALPLAPGHFFRPAKPRVVVAGIIQDGKCNSGVEPSSRNGGHDVVPGVAALPLRPDGAVRHPVLQLHPGDCLAAAMIPRATRHITRVDHRDALLATSVGHRGGHLLLFEHVLVEAECVYHMVADDAGQNAIPLDEPRVEMEHPNDRLAVQLGTRHPPRLDVVVIHRPRSDQEEVVDVFIAPLWAKLRLEKLAAKRSRSGVDSRGP